MLARQLAVGRRWPLKAEDSRIIDWEHKQIMFPHSSRLQEHAMRTVIFGFFHRMGRPMYVSWQLRTTRLEIGMPNMMLQRGLHHKEVCRSLTCQGLLASIPEAQMLARQLPTHPTARRGKGRRWAATSATRDAAAVAKETSDVRTLRLQSCTRPRTVATREAP